MEALVIENLFLKENYEKLKEYNNSVELFNLVNKEYLNKYLLFACKNNHTSIIKFLLTLTNLPDINTKNSEKGTTPLIFAVCENNIDLVNFFVHNFVELDVNLSGNDGWTPLMWASYKGYFDICQILLSSDAHINAVNIYGQTALMVACYNNQLRIVNLLLANKADPYIVSYLGNTALLLAKNKKNKEIVEFLNSVMSNNKFNFCLCN